MGNTLQPASGALATITSAAPGPLADLPYVQAVTSDVLALDADPSHTVSTNDPPPERARDIAARL
jgi:hypothetical protein